MKRTGRGFAIYTEFPETRGCTVRVQESSSVQRACWIFCTNAGAYTDRKVGVDVAPHLTPAQARRVAKALMRFADGKTK